MEEQQQQFLTNVGSGLLANAMFVVLYIARECLKKKVKHSECNSGCLSCKTDIQNTQRSDVNIAENNV